MCYLAIVTKTVVRGGLRKISSYPDWRFLFYALPSRWIGRCSARLMGVHSFPLFALEPTVDNWTKSV